MGPSRKLCGAPGGVAFRALRSISRSTLLQTRLQGALPPEHGGEVRVADVNPVNTPALAAPPAASAESVTVRRLRAVMAASIGSRRGGVELRAVHGLYYLSIEHLMRADQFVRLDPMQSLVAMTAGFRRVTPRGYDTVQGEATAHYRDALDVDVDATSWSGGSSSGPAPSTPA